jgi:hypothetical protein
VDTASDSHERADGLARWRRGWSACGIAHLALSIFWMFDLCPKVVLNWLNHHYEHLAWFGPSVALSYWDEAVGSIYAYGFGTFVLAAVAMIARCATTSRARLVSTLAFAAGWVFFGGVASSPWY